MKSLTFIPKKKLGTKEMSVVPLRCGFFIIVLDLRLTKIGLGSSGEFPFSVATNI